MVIHHFRRHATGLLPAAIVVSVAVFWVYAAVVRAAKTAANEIVEHCGPTTSAHGLGRLITGMTKDGLLILSALADTASDWVPVIAAIILIIRHFPQRCH
eukprot:symbB.v1.2.017372.t1/scaffold1352.1/size234417/21